METRPITEEEWASTTPAMVAGPGGLGGPVPWGCTKIWMHIYHMYAVAQISKTDTQFNLRSTDCRELSVLTESRE